MTENPADIANKKQNQIPTTDVSRAQFEIAMKVVKPHLQTALTNLRIAHKRACDEAKKASEQKDNARTV